MGSMACPDLLNDMDDEDVASFATIDEPADLTARGGARPPRRIRSPPDHWERAGIKLVPTRRTDYAIRALIFIEER